MFFQIGKIGKFFANIVLWLARKTLLFDNASIGRILKQKNLGRILEQKYFKTHFSVKQI